MKTYARFCVPGYTFVG